MLVVTCNANVFTAFESVLSKQTFANLVATPDYAYPGDTMSLSSKETFKRKQAARF